MTVGAKGELEQSTDQVDTETALQWTIEDASEIAKLLSYQYSEKFQTEYEKLLQNRAFQGWVKKGNDPLVFAETYFSGFGPELPKLKPNRLTQDNDFVT